MRYLILVIVFLFSANENLYAQLIDGQLGLDEYPAEIGGLANPVSVQENWTGFGDNFNELNAMFVNFDDNNLYLLFTGNLEYNGNDFELFIDTEPGGQNTIVSPNPDVSTNTLNFNFPGLTFDMGFEPDHYFTFHQQTIDGTSYGDYAKLGTTMDFSTGSAPNGNLVTLSNGAQIFVDNSNTTGVTGVDAANAELANTGIEISIPLSVLGISEGTELSLMAIINGSSHDYLSNQSLPPLPFGTDNLGGDGMGNWINGSLALIDFNNFTGDQYISITLEQAAAVPTISEWGLIILSLLILIFGVSAYRLDLSKKLVS